MCVKGVHQSTTNWSKYVAISYACFLLLFSVVVCRRRNMLRHITINCVHHTQHDYFHTHVVEVFFCVFESLYKTNEQIHDTGQSLWGYTLTTAYQPPTIQWSFPIKMTDTIFSPVENCVIFVTSLFPVWDESIGGYVMVMVDWARYIRNFTKL